MAYVYKHIREDTNEVFYIGIGNQDKYKRAYSLIKRNKFWRNIVSNTIFKVKIILDNLSWEEACSEEIKLISLYGRRDLGLGSLVNLTNGGDGTLGVIHTKEWYKKQKITNNKKGKVLSKETKEKISLNHKSKNLGITSGNKAIEVFDKNWNHINSYNSILEASKELNIGRWIIDKFLAGSTKKPYKYRFKYK